MTDTVSLQTGQTFRLGKIAQIVVVDEKPVAGSTSESPEFGTKETGQFHAKSESPVVGVGATRAQLTRTPALLPNAPSDSSAWYWHGMIALATALIAAVAFLAYLTYTRIYPARGYTPLGLASGALGTFLLCCVAFYAARKRALQEWMPWRLLTWLRFHLWLSVIGCWLVMLHAGFHFDGGSGTFTALALAATVLTGVGGWYLYRKVPNQVFQTVGNLATDNVRRQIESLDYKLEDCVAGRGANLAEYAQHLSSENPHKSASGASHDTRPAFADPADRLVATKVECLTGEKLALISKLKRQISLRRSLRGWLLVHIPIALLFFAMLSVHIYDAMEIKWMVKTAGPHDYADPMSCAKCHQDQYDEWIGSMHAIAQLSPVTDLQNRLVVLKDRFDRGGKGIEVGDLCVKCHAPTSRLGDDVEDEILAIEDRAVAGHFGVSCVACHQISEIHPTAPFAEDKTRVRFKNAENLTYTQGRSMIGPFGNKHPSVGNKEHQGEFGAHFKDSSFCASCHTVMVDPKGPDNLVALQNTYQEWLDGGDKTIPVNWNAKGVNCIDCHGKPLDSLVAEAKRMESARLPLDVRIKAFAELVPTNALTPLSARRLAAQPIDGFDLPLRVRRNHLHTFVGVDYHLEKDLPYQASDPRAGENPRIQAQTIDLVEDLMRIAAAIQIVGVRENVIDVQVANLATGHHLPAGFAFAREMWLEVALASTASGGPYTVVAGGRDGRALQPDERLNKFSEGRAGMLKNFQAVLWNGVPGRQNSDGSQTGETVLQNECVKVLKGKEAVAQGFFDREQFLKPGEIRKLQLRVAPAELANARRIRVRLRFRNYPPEFLDQLADRFEAKQNRYLPPTELGNVTLDRDMWRPDKARAERTRNLIKGLKIFEMADDEISRSAQQRAAGEW